MQSYYEVRKTTINFLVEAKSIRCVQKIDVIQKNFNLPFETNNVEWFKELSSSKHQNIEKSQSSK